MIIGLHRLRADWEPLDPPDGWVPCCFGSANDGPQGCTCWEPVYDHDQQTSQVGRSQVRATLCEDCAYRRNSPERADAQEAQHLLELPTSGQPFYCHQGMRRVIEWRHPDGRIVPADPRDYQPEIPIDGFPRKADGTCADICGGWAALAKRVDGPLAPGDPVIWAFESRGGYGYVQHVPGTVVLVTAKRIRIRVQRADGTEVERTVTPARVTRDQKRTPKLEKGASA